MGSDALEIYTAGARADERLPLVVLLHGYGGSPQRIARLVDGLSLRARVVVPHGLFHVEAGWGWFARYWQRSSEEIAPGIMHAADVVARVIDDEVKTRRTCGRPIAVGFSQGGFLTYALAARSPPLLGAAFPIGGMLPPSLRPGARSAGPLPRVEAFHGEADSVVDPGEDRETQAHFAAAGFAGELHSYPGVPHLIPPSMAADLRASIEQAIREAGCATSTTAGH
jgi:phospholipase/carboxylesterase